MKTFLENIIMIVKILGEIKEGLEAWRVEKRRVERAVEENEVWLDSADVKQLLNIGKATLYRRREDGVWVSKKIGKKWFYLKSSLY
jgi:hypothetical protein